MAKPNLPGFHEDTPPPPPKPFQRDPNDPLDGLTQDELLALRSRIDLLIPIRSLKDLDIERETLIQFLSTQRLQTEVLQDPETPANQKAQVANAVASTLATLARLQIEVYTSERGKKLEMILVEAFKQLPTDQRDEALDKYEQLARSGMAGTL